jgi:hypothetical protein
MKDKLSIKINNLYLINETKHDFQPNTYLLSLECKLVDYRTKPTSIIPSSPLNSPCQSIEMQKNNKIRQIKFNYMNHSLCFDINNGNNVLCYSYNHKLSRTINSKWRCEYNHKLNKFFVSLYSSKHIKSGEKFISFVDYIQTSPLFIHSSSITAGDDDSDFWVSIAMDTPPDLELDYKRSYGISSTELLLLSENHPPSTIISDEDDLTSLSLSSLTQYTPNQRILCTSPIPNDDVKSVASSPCTPSSSSSTSTYKFNNENKCCRIDLVHIAENKNEKGHIQRVLMFEFK